MTKAKTTRHALLMSVLSMMLCMAMLVSSTFAWFTDSVTSGVNTIVAGNLDVALYHSNGNVTDEQVGAETKLFVSDDGEAILWEPGVMVYENFTVKNVGTLALKYRLTVSAGDYNAVTVDGKEKSLKDMLKVAILSEAFDGDRAAAQALTFDKTIADFEKDGRIAAGAEDDTYAIVIYWEPSENDNDYNLNNGRLANDEGKQLYIDFGVSLFATQDTVESDSFDEKYDKNAWPYPTKVFDPAALQEAIDETGNVQIVENIAYVNTATLGTDSRTPVITVAENGMAVVDFDGNKLTINSASGRNGIMGAKNAILTLSNGTIEQDKIYGSSNPVIHANKGTVILENMNVSLAPYSSSGYTVSAGTDKGKLIIRNSTISRDLNGAAEGKYYSAVFVGSQSEGEIDDKSIINGSVYVSSNAKLTITDSTVNGGLYKDSASDSRLIIVSGKFTQDPTPYLAENSYVSEEPVDGYYIVIHIDETEVEDQFGE